MNLDVEEIFGMDNKRQKEIKNLINKLVQLKYEFGAVGMFKTMHALEVGVTACGYELAEEMEKENGQ